MTETILLHLKWQQYLHICKDGMSAGGWHVTKRLTLWPKYVGWDHPVTGVARGLCAAPTLMLLLLHFWLADNSSRVLFISLNMLSWVYPLSFPALSKPPHAPCSILREHHLQLLIGVTDTPACEENELVKKELWKPTNLLCVMKQNFLNDTVQVSSVHNMP